MNISDADFERALHTIEEYASQNQRARRSPLSPVGEFIKLLMFDAPVKVVEGIIEIYRLLKKRSKKR